MAMSVNQRFMELPKLSEPLPQLNGGRRLVQSLTQQIRINPNKMIHNVTGLLQMNVSTTCTNKDTQHTLQLSPSGLVEWALGTRLEVFRTEQLRSLKSKLLARLKEEGQVLLQGKWSHNHYTGGYSKWV